MAIDLIVYSFIRIFAPEKKLELTRQQHKTATKRMNTKDAFKQMMRKVMTTAWQICRITGEEFAECLRRGWQAYKLQVAMMRRIVRFSYIKKSTGELRFALGTTDPRRYTYEAVGGRDSKLTDCIRYWDTEKQGWRMFKVFNLQTVEA